MKKLIAFDLDGTLAPSKSPADDRMTNALLQLLDKFQVCVISGGKFQQFEKQLLSNLEAGPAQLERLHIMPTCGTRYYSYDLAKQDWEQVYAEDFSESEKKQIVDALNKGFDDLDMRAARTYGETIEDRGSQVTFSVLGQDIVDELGEEGLRLKHDWDPDNKKKNKLRDYIAPLIPDFEVRVGGVTSIDVTKKGIDKAYGMRKLMELLDISKDDILFIGDRVQPGGNDYPVKAFGIDCIEISHWQDGSGCRGHPSRRMKAVVTGGAGYIGSLITDLVRALSSALSKLSAGKHIIFNLGNGKGFSSAWEFYQANTSKD